MPAVQDDGDVDIDDIALTQRLVVGYAVADDMVDRGADSMAIAAIAQAGGQGAMADGIVISHLVQRGGGDARLDQRHHQVQHLGGQPPGLAHAVKGRRIMDRHGQMGLARGFENLGVGGEGHGGLI